MRLARELLGKPKDVTTFVGSDHGFAPQFLAIDASKVLVDLGLLSTPQTSNCRPATGETIGKAKACWAGGAVQIYLNLVGRNPAGGGLQRVAVADVAGIVAQIKAAFLGVDSNDWDGDGAAEGWKVIDRVFTRAEAATSPTVRDHDGHGAPDAQLVTWSFSYPPYQFDAATPGMLDREVGVLRTARLRPGRPGPRRQREHARHVLCRRQRHRQRQLHGAKHRPRPDDRLPPCEFPNPSIRRAACCARCCVARAGRR